jgi:hypothetical protein
VLLGVPVIADILDVPMLVSDAPEPEKLAAVMLPPASTFASTVAEEFWNSAKSPVCEAAPFTTKPLVPALPAVASKLVPLLLLLMKEPPKFVPVAVVAIPYTPMPLTLLFPKKPPTVAPVALEALP